MYGLAPEKIYVCAAIARQLQSQKLNEIGHISVISQPINMIDAVLESYWISISYILFLNFVSYRPKIEISIGVRYLFFWDTLYLIVTRDV